MLGQQRTALAVTRAPVHSGTVSAASTTTIVHVDDHVDDLMMIRPARSQLVQSAIA
jgi:hypothetical protein